MAEHTDQRRRPRAGVYPGTFDPIHNGHLDIIRRATRVVDRLVIAVAVNVGKDPMLSLDERVSLVEHEARALMDGNRVTGAGSRSLRSTICSWISRAASARW